MQILAIKEQKNIHGGQEGDPSYEELPLISLVGFTIEGLPGFAQPPFQLDREIDWEKTRKLMQSDASIYGKHWTIKYLVY